MNQRSWNLAKEVAEKSTDSSERAKMEALLSDAELSGNPLTPDAQPALSGGGN